MKPQRFHGATSREVLRKVKQALGGDALIVTNRATDNGGIEITALPALALGMEAGIPQTPTPASAAAPAPAAAAAPVAAPQTMQILKAQQRAQAPQAAPAAADGIVQQLMAELKAMKTAMQRELAGIAWSDLMRRDPAAGAVMQTLLESGFSPALAREILAAVAGQQDAIAVRKSAGVEIGRRLQIVESDDLVTRGGVYALIGPTGVGKTTTVAKLAARCVVRHGAGQIVLLTTDAYRIAGHDQLRVYARILGVPVHMIKDAEDLRATLADLKGRKTVLIDTVGMSQRDQLVGEQAALLAGGGAAVKRLLLLNATCNAHTLDEVVGAYAKGGVHGSIVTKVDEAAGVANVLDILIRHRLLLHYVTNGQRVPEDLHMPNRAWLLHRAVRPLAAGSAHGLSNDEFPLLAAGAAREMAHA
jgi:flagellar biosynthesis protein FlhF